MPIDQAAKHAPRVAACAAMPAAAPAAAMTAVALAATQAERNLAERPSAPAAKMPAPLPERIAETAAAGIVTLGTSPKEAAATPAQRNFAESMSAPAQTALPKSGSYS